MNIFMAWMGILIHHSAVKDNVVLSDFEAIKRFHMSWRYHGDIITEDEAKALIAAGSKGVVPPWRDIAYHKVTEQVKGKFTTRDGRPLWMRGAHEPKVNKTHIGWCFVGDFDKQKPPSALYDEGALQIVKTMELCPNVRLERIEPHRKYSTKTCPGLLFDMGELEARVRYYAGRS